MNCQFQRFDICGGVSKKVLASVLLSTCAVVSILQDEAVHALPLPTHDVSAAPTDTFDINSETLQVTFVPPNGDAPRETRGGAARDGSCLLSDAMEGPSLTALIPHSNYGLTTQSHPVFLVYMPSVPTGSVFFNLRDEQGQSVYETFLPIEEAGIVAVEMPKDAPPLEQGKNYEWGVAVPCSARLRPDSPFVSGWIQRTNDGNGEVMAVEEPSQILASAHQYGQDGIWYDMLALLSDLKEDVPESAVVERSWQNILDLASLSGLSS